MSCHDQRTTAMDPTSFREFHQSIIIKSVSFFNWWFQLLFFKPKGTVNNFAFIAQLDHQQESGYCTKFSQHNSVRSMQQDNIKLVSKYDSQNITIIFFQSCNIIKSILSKFNSCDIFGSCFSLHWRTNQEQLWTIK